jgi:hypothetical protein
VEEFEVPGVASDEDPAVLGSIEKVFIVRVALTSKLLGGVGGVREPLELGIEDWDDVMVEKEFDHGASGEPDVGGQPCVN